MKKTAILMTILVLTLSLMSGCGCMPQKNVNPTTPTRDTMTVPATTAPTVTTMPTTEPATEPATLPANTEQESGTADMTGPAASEGEGNARSRRMR